MENWLLIDGFNLLFRAYHAVPELRRADGFMTNALHGWVRMLWRLQDTYKPDHIAVFMDSGGSARREALLGGYKATRRETPADLKAQIPLAHDIARAFGMRVVAQAGVEADDLLATAARTLSAAGARIRIVSADKDLTQCVGGNITQLLPPAPGGGPDAAWRELDAAGVEEKFGVPPARIAEYLALIGDTSDNIPGLDGVGPKTAAAWLSKYGSIEGVIENCGMLSPKRFQAIVHASADRIRANLQLTTLHPEPVPDLTPPAPDPAAISRLLTDLEMTRTLAEAARRYGFQPAATA